MPPDLPLSPIFGKEGNDTPHCAEETTARGPNRFVADGNYDVILAVWEER